jgi:glycerol kinase
LGDQQAALFGQTAFEPGDAKNTYGTGLFLMLNTGTKPIPSKHGLLTTVAYQLGSDGPVHYALEGSVSHAGATIQWLRDQLQIISSASESASLATSRNDGLYMVPAFGGLFAPHWRSNARACIVGMTASHHRGHVCRAALEAAAYQTREVFDAIVADSSVQLKSLKVDGGMTHNPLLMQFQADMLGVAVIQPVVMETTSMGAAFAAGLAVGTWKDLDEIRALWGVAKVYEPQMSEDERTKNWAGWKKAVTRSWDWVEEEESTAAVADDEGDKFEDCIDFIDDRRSSTFGGSYVVSLALVAGMATATGFVLGRFSVRQRN